MVNAMLKPTDVIQSLQSTRRNLWMKAAPLCGFCDSVTARSGWQRMQGRSYGVYLHGIRYCGAECLERALCDELAKERYTPMRSAVAAHRIPLGLILVSRQQLTAGQLRIALAEQRAAGRRKLGEWLQELGFATELEITAALARQWSCPVLRGEAAMISRDRCPAIPLALLKAFQMMPVEMVEASRTLLVAFSDGVDYTVLYAIQSMLGYHTESCLVNTSLLQAHLQTLARIRVSDDVVFDRVQHSECAQIIVSYTAKVGAKDVRLARCGNHLWARLERPKRAALNLVLSTPPETVLTLLPSAIAASAS